MRISKEFLRVMIIIEVLRTKIKVEVINHNLKEDWCNKPKRYHWSQTEKIHQCPLSFQHASSGIFLNQIIDCITRGIAHPQVQVNLTSTIKPPSWRSISSQRMDYQSLTPMGMSLNLIPWVKELTTLDMWQP